VAELRERTATVAEGGAGGDDPVREVLAAIPGVLTADAPRRPGAPWLITVKPASEDVRVRRAILAAAGSAGLDLTSIRPLPPSLEEIYRRAVERASHGHAREVR